MSTVFNPFPGLRSFESDEDHLFFGREEDLDELLRRLRTGRFLAVLGTSGCGKSSLVKSGLVPALQGGFMSGAGASWRIGVMRPGEDPVGRLAVALGTPGVLGRDVEAETASVEAAFLESTLRRGELGLVAAVREARLPEGDRVLLVVDQFEELFRFQKSRRTADARGEAVSFVQLLLAAAAQSVVPVYVVLTMRSEFLGAAIEIPRLAAAINRGQYLVPLLDREQRRRAIVGPVAVGGGAISPRLVWRLLNDVGDDPDQLPTLQHALMRTWDRWQGDHADGEPLDLRHYEEVGTVHEALDRHAEEAFGELTAGPQRRIAEVLFKRLTEREPGSPHGVRRPSRLGEICAVAGAGEGPTSAVIEVFRRPGRSFLTPAVGDLAADTIIDLSHESLMRIWRRLIRWVDEETEAATFYRRLSEAAARHAAGEAALWREPELGLGRRWRARHRPTAAWAERYDAHFDRASRFLATSQRRKRLAIGAVTVLSSVVVLVILGVAAIALQQKGEALEQWAVAEEQRQEAEQARQDAEQARQDAENARDAERSARDEAEAQQQLAEKQERLADAARLEAEQQQAIAERKSEEADLARQEAEEAEQGAIVSRDQARRAEGEAEDARERAQQAEREQERLRRLADARALANLTLGLTEANQRELAALLALQALHLNLDAGGPNDEPEIYNALRLALERLDRERSAVLTTHPRPVRALAVDARGEVASGSEDGTVRHGGTETLLPTEVRSLALSAAGRLAVGGLDGSLRLLAPEQLLVEGGASTDALAFHPGREDLAAGFGDGHVRIFDLAGSTSKPWDAGAPVTSLAWDGTGAALAVGAGDAVLVMQAEGEPVRRSAGAAVRSVAFDTTGRWLAAGTVHGPIVLWDRETDTERALIGHRARVEGLAFHPHRSLLASASLDRTLRLWQAPQPDTPVILAGHRGWVWATAFDPSGEQLVSASADRTVRRWTTSSAKLAEELCRVLERDLTGGERDEYLGGVERVATCPKNGTP